MAALDAFVENVAHLEVNIILSVSADKTEIPAHIAQIAQEI